MDARHAVLDSRHRLQRGWLITDAYKGGMRRGGGSGNHSAISSSRPEKKMAASAPWTGGYVDPYETDIWEALDMDESWAWWDWQTPRRRRPRHRNRVDNQGLVPTAVDWRETNDTHLITLELPGARKEELKVQVEDDRFLEISGERGKEKEEEEEEEKTGETWHLKERRRGNFKRRIKLPQNANLDEIKCSLDHGILTVTIAKKDTTPRPTPKIRTIELA